MDLLSIDSLSDQQIAAILDRSAEFFAANREGRYSDPLRGKIVFNLFYENSTRTAMSLPTIAS